jgi:hypothetical protein
VGAGRDPTVSIVFHGDGDATVHPSNGDAIFSEVHGDAAVRSGGNSLRETTLPLAGQRGYTRSIEIGLGGVTNRELWVVHGGGHAWSGGCEGESGTDSHGPDASREMMRFFLQHRLVALPHRKLGTSRSGNLRMQAA